MESNLIDKEEDKSESNDEDDDEQSIDLLEEEEDPKFVEHLFTNKESCSNISNAYQGGTSPAEVSSENFPAVDCLAKGQSYSPEGIDESIDYEIDNTKVLEHGVCEKISSDNRNIFSRPKVIGDGLDCGFPPKGKGQDEICPNQGSVFETNNKLDQFVETPMGQKKKGSAIIGKIEDLLRDKKEEIVHPDDSVIIRYNNRIKRRVIDSPNQVAISDIDLYLEVQKTIEVGEMLGFKLEGTLKKLESNIGRQGREWSSDSGQTVGRVSLLLILASLDSLR
ncbi:hypothetical protein L6452_03697 [Arctium lappa]|uniref:Uncharacterized protein n=1 Tax=Arctium lappa TaxID=4217 RepID=A0ACB9FP67_ARCLA|nr:hypothetical protein L6452_03697 [Arctium lappa]